MQLSPHFELSELTASSKAKILGIDNTPPPELIPRLVLVAEMLERKYGCGQQEHLRPPTRACC
jgi:zinc D-Ala-D-Ala carboxypeptidase